MQNYEFKLNAAYCLYNGAAVFSQQGSYICFATESDNDAVLRRRLEKAFLNHLDFVVRQKGVPLEYKNMPKVEFITRSHEEIRKLVSRIYYDDGIERISEEEKKLSMEKEAAAVILLDSLLNEGRKLGATDIHIEKGLVRMRVDGKLVEYARIQKDRESELIGRIKLLAGMNLLEKRSSQDGSFCYGENSPLFVRVSSMGIIGKHKDEMEESVVMRLLDSKRLPLSLDKLGFTEKQTVAVDVLSSCKNGLIVISGATGSGKSTTAASILLGMSKRNGASQKILTLEDPVEYVIPGVTQLKVDKSKPNVFSKTLESVFRQDPDVIMIGEIRDEETAKTALRASLTGHLVIATVHAEDAVTTILRLEELGMNRRILGSVLRGVISQELEHEDDGLRLICDVACVKSLESVLNRDCTTEEIESSFIHFTNVREQLVSWNESRKKKLVTLKAGLNLSRNRKEVL